MEYRNRFSKEDIIVRKNLGEEKQKKKGKKDFEGKLSIVPPPPIYPSIRVYACGGNVFNSIQKFKHTLPMFDNGALILIKGLTLKLNIHGAEGVNLFTL